MRTFFTFLVIACVVAMSSGAFAAVSVKYSNCTDQALCLSGCQTAEVPSEECLNFGGNQSEVIVCDPVMSVAGDLSYFFDSGCTDLWFTNAFLCGHCSNSGGGNYTQVRCDQEKDVEFISIYKCLGNKTTNATGTNCKANCQNPWNVTKGQCISTQVTEEHLESYRRQPAALRQRGELAKREPPRVGQLAYAYYTGATLSTSVRITQWFANNKCGGVPSLTAAWPDKSCIRGGSLQCLY